MYVTTFYSFKGGGGRTMALVNVAVELAQRGRGVLAVDFDLEAPGLDTFNILRSRKRRPGIVDFVTEYLDTGRAPEAERFIHDSKDAGENGGCLWVMPSGEQDEKYATSFREIDWLDLYERHDGYLLFEDLKAQWEQFVKPDYVLIDSRTGHTDTGGICTRQLPDAVAILFFPNDQNLRGQNAIVFRNSPTRAESPQVHWGIIGSIAVPVILHMIQRERKDEVEFPSLMFLRKVPYRSFRRQRVRHWFLLLLRCAALLLLLFAFARPFIRAAALAAMTDGAREVVVLLDRSYSMSFGGRWDEAQTLATDTIAALDSGDRATVILFDGGAETGPRSTTDRASLRGLVENAEVGSGVTRYGPALKLAEGIFESSDLPRLEAVLISDFQRAGVESAVGVRFPQGTVLTPIPVGEDDATGANVSVAGVLFEREYFSGRERIQVAARLTNRGPTTAITGLDVALDMEGREVETLTGDLAPAGSTTVDFAPVTLADAQMFGAVRIAPDALPADDVFHFIVSPGQVVTVLVVGSASAPDDANLFLTRALGIGSEPAFDVRATTLESFSAADLADRQVVVLNDTRPPAGAAGEALAAFVEAGGGLLVVAGERTAWPQDDPGLLPGGVAAPQDRDGRGGSLGFVDYSHPVFEVFSAPRSGDVTTARFFRFRPVEATPDAVVVARFDDGNPALIEQRIGAGRVLLWASTIDTFWNDFAKKPVYLPFIHRMVQHLADYAPPTPWVLAGQVLNLAEQEVALGEGGTAAAEYVVMSPTGERLPVAVGERAGFLDLTEQGVYEVHDANAAEELPLLLAVNVDLAEADLSAVDPEELASMVTGRAGGDRTAAGGPARVIPADDLERRQSVWWYLLVAAALLFVAETLVSNRLSRTVLSTE